jgi:hypothetical protein
MEQLFARATNISHPCPPLPQPAFVQASSGFASTRSAAEQWSAQQPGHPHAVGMAISMLAVNHLKRPEAQLISKGRRNGATKKFRGLENNAIACQAIVCKAALIRRFRGVASAISQVGREANDERVRRLQEACRRINLYGDAKVLCRYYLSAKAAFHKHTGNWAGNSAFAGDFPF